jgi:hypothetical protein
MAQTSSINVSSTPKTFGSGYAFGVPIGDLGWFGSLLIGVAAGFIAFFATTFCSIFVILIYNSSTHSTIDYALSYRRIGLPVGLVVLVLALGYLGSLWVKRILRRS